MLIRIIILFSLTSMLASCYSFKGISIPPDVKSYYVDQTTIQSGERTQLTPGDMPERFMEALRGKLRNQSNLIPNDVSPDVEFISSITEFDIDDQARSPDNELATLYKLNASIRVEYISNTNEDDSWSQTFSHTINFDPSVDLQTAQDGFIDEILEQITEQVFNKSYTNW